MENQNVCPVERAGALDNGLRRLLQNPKKILGPYLKKGMHIADLGCGPGFFTVPMAEMVGGEGKVYAYDLQEEMLGKIFLKIKNSELEERISLLVCGATSFEFISKVDFMLAFYMVHETPDPERTLKEMYDNLVSGGKAFVVEPVFHVSKKTFNLLKESCRKVGFSIVREPKMFLSRALVLEKR